MTTKYVCPICGYSELTQPPRDSDGGSYEICLSCGFQFGVSDDDRGYSDEAWRERWIASGMKWSSVGIEPPANWNPQQQLANLLASGG